MAIESEDCDLQHNHTHCSACHLSYAIQRLGHAFPVLSPARALLCRIPLGLRPSLPGSAASCPALFVGLSATMAESDLPCRFIIGYGSSPSRCRPGLVTAGQTQDLPVPVQRASTHARFFDHAGSSRHSRLRACLNRLPPSQWCRHPGYESLRGSMAGLCAPLPTLRCRPHGRPRTAQGRCGSLLLHRIGLAPTTRCRSPGALRKILDTVGRTGSPFAFDLPPLIKEIQTGPPRPTCGCRPPESESTRRVPLTYRVFQPPTPSTSLSASCGPHVPGSYSYIGLGP